MSPGHHGLQLYARVGKFGVVTERTVHVVVYVTKDKARLVQGSVSVPPGPSCAVLARHESIGPKNLEMHPD